MQEIITTIVVMNLVYAPIFCYLILRLRSLKNQALADPLTGLPNRLLFLDRLEVAIANAKRNRTDLSVLFIDLNGFKLINDKHGHSVGDTALSITAKRIKSCLRGSDILARISGDEFVLIMHTKDEQIIARKAEQIAKEVAGPIVGVGSTLGVSIGVSHFGAHSENAAELLRFADEAMYIAKSLSKKNNNQSALIFYTDNPLDNTQEH